MRYQYLVDFRHGIRYLPIFLAILGTTPMLPPVVAWSDNIPIISIIAVEWQRMLLNKLPPRVMTENLPEFYAHLLEKKTPHRKLLFFSNRDSIRKTREAFFNFKKSGAFYVISFVIQFNITSFWYWLRSLCPSFPMSSTTPKPIRSLLIKCLPCLLIVFDRTQL